MRLESCSLTAAISGIDQDLSRQYVMCDTDRHNITFCYENNEEWKAENIETIHQDQGAESAFVHDEHTNAATISECVEHTGKESENLTFSVEAEKMTSLFENVDDWKTVRQRYSYDMLLIMK